MAMNAFKHDQLKIEEGNNFKPKQEMPPQQLLIAALLRDLQTNPSQKFIPNDSMDFLHAVPSIIRSNFSLLDKGWCQRISRAERYLNHHGVKTDFSKRYWGNPNQLQEFLVALEKFNSK